MAGAAVRASFNDSWRRPRAAEQAPWRYFHRQLSRDGGAARGADELSGAAGLGAPRRRPRNFLARRADQRIPARARHTFARSFRFRQALLAEPALHKRITAAAAARFRLAILHPCRL